MRSIPAARLLLAPLFAAAIFTAPAAAQIGEILPPYPMPLTPPCLCLYGPDSAINQRRFERIRDEQAWVTLWAEHAGPTSPAPALAPKVDFARYEVIAFFRGDSQNRNGEIAEDVEITKDLVRIRFDSASYQTAVIADPRQPAPQSAAAPCRPYGLWVIPRTSKPIAIEENLQGVKGFPPVWRAQHQFSALPEEGC